MHGLVNVFSDIALNTDIWLQWLAHIQNCEICYLLLLMHTRNSAVWDALRAIMHKRNVLKLEYKQEWLIDIHQTAVGGQQVDEHQQCQCGSHKGGPIVEFGKDRVITI